MTFEEIILFLIASSRTIQVVTMTMSDLFHIKVAMIDISVET
jgi:hypothetical protein